MISKIKYIALVALLLVIPYPPLPPKQIPATYEVRSDEVILRWTEQGGVTYCIAVNDVCVMPGECYFPRIEEVHAKKYPGAEYSIQRYQGETQLNTIYPTAMYNVYLPGVSK